MLAIDDEGGGKYFGDFVHSNGDSVVDSKEVERVKEKARQKKQARNKT